MAVSDRHTQVSECQRIETAGGQVLDEEDVARRFGHLGAIGQKVLPMYPIVNVPVAESAFALGDLILVMGEHVVHATGMDVEPFAQILVGHRRTFDVPARKALAPGTVPFYVPARFSRLPKRKVARVPLQRVSFCPHAFQQITTEVIRQLAVFGVAIHIEVDVPAGFVCRSFFHQRPNHFQHFRDVLRCPGEYVGRQNVQVCFIAPEAIGVKLADLLNGLAFFQRGHDHLVAARLNQLLPHVADVGDVFDVVNLVTVSGQNTTYPVCHQVSTQVADVCVPVHRRSTRVHRDATRRHGLDFLDGFGKGVINS